jgi:hypothetical protein
MSFLDHILNTLYKRAGANSVFLASQKQKSQLLLAPETNNSTSLELKTTSPA